MNEKTTSASSHVIESWKCPKCGANNKFNPNICTSCNYSKIPPVQVLPPKSRQIWQVISLVFIGLMLALQIGCAVTMYMGSGLNLLYGVEDPFLATALRFPDMILYSHFATAGVCALLGIWTLIELIKAIVNRDNLTKSLHRSAITTCIAMWAFPVVNILTDMVVTAIKKNGVNLRSFSAYDVFDLGLNILIPLIITVVSLIIMFFNNRLAPETNLDEEE